MPLQSTVVPSGSSNKAVAASAAAAAASPDPDPAAPAAPAAAAADAAAAAAAAPLGCICSGLTNRGFFASGNERTTQQLSLSRLHTSS